MNGYVAEAFRWQTDFNPGSQLVNSYVAMESALTAGAYGDTSSEQSLAANLIDLLTFGFNSEGRDYWLDYPDTSGATMYYMEGTQAAAGKWINLYDPNDAATAGTWYYNRAYETGSLILDAASMLIPLYDGNWPYIYEYGDYADAPRPIKRVTPATGVFSPLNPLGTDGYEILAFAAVPVAGTIGQHAFSWFDENIDIRPMMASVIDARDYDDPQWIDLGSSTGMTGNHSFQFHADAATTRSFWQVVVQQTGVHLIS